VIFNVAMFDALTIEEKHLILFLKQFKYIMLVKRIVTLPKVALTRKNTTQTQQSAKAARISKRLTDAGPIPLNQKPNTKAPRRLSFYTAAFLITSTTAAAIYDLNFRTDSVIAAYYNGSTLQRYVAEISGSVNEIYKPETDKLLPDWGSLPFYAGVLPGTPAMPILVLDLERTLIGSIHDTKVNKYMEAECSHSISATLIFSTDGGMLSVLESRNYCAR